MAYPFLPLDFIMFFISCLAPKADTSGKMLVWIRMNILMIHKNFLIRIQSKAAFWFFTKIVNKTSDGWNAVAQYYFSNGGNYNNPDHPLRVKFEKLYT